MSEQLSLVVLVIALASGLVSSVVTTSYVNRQQPVFFRYLLINILLFNLLILSGLVLRYLQMPSQAIELSDYPGVLPVLFVLMAALKLAWLYVFVLMNISLPADVLSRKVPVVLSRSGLAFMTVFAILLFTAWFGQLNELLSYTMGTFEITVIGGAMVSTLWLLKTASRLRDGQRRLSLGVFAGYHLCLMGVVLVILVLGWLDSGLPARVHVMTNGAFLSLYNLFPLIWLKWIRVAPVSVNQEKFDLFGITRREREIISLIQDGKTNQEIADMLFISIATVKDHNHNIFKKCGIRNRLELANLFQV